MSRVTFFNSNGDVISSSIFSDFRPMMPDGASYVFEGDIADINNVYLKTDTMEVAGKLPFDAVIENATISNVPIGTTALIEGNVYQVGDGSIELEMNTNEEVRVMLSHPHYIDETFFIGGDQ